MAVGGTPIAPANPVEFMVGAATVTGSINIILGIPLYKFLKRKNHLAIFDTSVYGAKHFQPLRTRLRICPWHIRIF